MKKIKYLDLFTGIGGFTLGIEQAYEECNLHRLSGSKEQGKDGDSGVHGRNSEESESSNWRNEAVCIGFSEIDKYATKIYQAHYPEHKNYGDITKINAEDLPDHDLLVGGFPCQSFSIAGKRGGFNDTRGTLFFDVARILKAKQPRNFILENVKGLLSHDTGRTFRTIISTLDELGYDLQWQVLNSKNFGVPQNRERVYIVGHLRGTSRPEVFPIGESNPVHLREITTGVSDAQRIYDPTGVGKTLKGLGGGLGAKTGLYAVDGAGKQEIATAIDANYHKGFGMRGTSRGRTMAVEDMKIRRLTPTECARLQGFPDDWHKIEGISDTQAYKCYGNAVTVNVVREIVRRLLK